jgi:hypothetical protein
LPAPAIPQTHTTHTHNAHTPHTPGGLSSTRTPNLGKKAKEAAADAKQSITEAIQGSSGSLPGTNSLATLADMTSNAKGDAADYKDPISSLGDKIAGVGCSGWQGGWSCWSLVRDRACAAAGGCSPRRPARVP